MSLLRVIFAGTPDFSAKYLLSLLKSSQYNLVGVITKPDFRSGRGKKLKINAVKKLALKNKIPILQPYKISNDKKKIFSLKPDIIIVVAYGLIFSEEILNFPKLGCINIHFSLLPRWRGSTPIQTAILKGDKKTGVTIIKMQKFVDSGDILYQKKCFIQSYDTTESMFSKLEKIGNIAMLKTIKNIQKKILNKRTQNILQATFTKKLKKKDGIIDWRISAIKLERQVRAFNPWPGSYFYFQNKKIIVWKAYTIFLDKKISKKPGEIFSINKFGIQMVTSKGLLNLTKIQFSGKKIIVAKDIFNSKKRFFLKN